MTFCTITDNSVYQLLEAVPSQINSSRSSFLKSTFLTTCSGLRAFIVLKKIHPEALKALKVLESDRVGVHPLLCYDQYTLLAFYRLKIRSNSQSWQQPLSIHPPPAPPPPKKKPWIDKQINKWTNKIKYKTNLKP